MKQLAKLCLLALAATPWTATAQSAAATDKVDFLGFVAYSDSWTDSGTNNPQGGFYTFSTDADEGFTAAGPTGRVEGNEVSATYHDNLVEQVKVSGYWYKYSVTYSRTNVDTWKDSSTADLGNKYEEGVAEDLTYDYTTGTTYAVTYNKLGNSEKGYLCTINPETGVFTRIASIPFMRTISADKDGNLWGIDGGGTLYTISKTDGATTAVGKTGFTPQELNQSATFDLRTGRLYWALYGFADTDTQHTNTLCGIVSVDLTTGKGTMVRSFPRYERISALIIKDAHPDAPATPTGLSVEPGEGSSITGTVSFTMPTLTYSQQASLSGTLSYSVRIDGEEVTTGTAAPGETVSTVCNYYKAGTHTTDVNCTLGSLTSPRTSLTAYIGTDSPAAPKDVTVTADEMQRSVTINWQPSTTSANGGYIDPTKVTYTVTRMPENTIVARNIAETSFTDTPDNELRRIRYTVTATYMRRESARTFSPWVHAGTSYEIPYVEAFDAEDDYNTFTAIDANGDGSDDWEAPCWKYDATYGAAFYYNKGTQTANDWLVTPPLAFSGDKVYKLTFMTYGYYGRTNHLQISLGAQPTAEAMSEPIFDEEYVSTMNSVKTYSVYLNPKADTRYVGFHNVTAEKDHMSIDNIYIEEIGSNLVPATVTDTKATGSVSNVTLSFRVPQTDMSGKAMEGNVSVKIYCGDETEPAATLSATPGETLTWTDQWAAAMLNTYTLIVANSYGDGTPASVSIDLSETAAPAPEELKAENLSATAVRLTWNKPQSAGNAPLLYSVYRMYDYEKTCIADNLSATEFIDLHATDALPDDSRQDVVSYLVYATNSAGEGEYAQTAKVPVGKAYTLPFAETWYQQATANNPWSLEGNGTASWIVEGYGYDPATRGQDGEGMVKFTVNSYTTANSGTASYISPAIDFTSLKNPKARFYIYRHPSLSTDLNVKVSVRTENGETIDLSNATIGAYAEEAGWTECNVDLTPAATLSRASLVFTGSGTVSGQNLHLDNLTISGDDYATDAAVEDFSVPAQVVAGYEHDVTVKVRNNGTQPLTGVRITITENGNAVSSDVLDKIAVGGSEDLVVSYEPTQVGLSTLSARVEVTGDEQTGNNVLSIPVVINEPTLAYVGKLRAALSDDNTHVTLSWDKPYTTPSAQYVTDDFESYPDFAISGIGGWTLHDGDGVLPFTFKDNTGSLIEWPNNTSKQAYIVFNPNETVLSGYILTHSGTKSMVSFGSPYATNDDWLISPRLSGKQQVISFYARGIDSQKAAERFKVLYSTTDTLTTSFHTVSGPKPLSGDTVWTRYRFALPEGAKYFAIHYIGHQQSGLMIDDVSFEGYYAPAAEPDGYEVLRNGQVLGDVLTELEYVEDLPESISRSEQITYQVRAIYGNNTSVLSEPFVFSIDGIDRVSGASATWQPVVKDGTLRIAGIGTQAATVTSTDGRTVGTLTEGRTLCLPHGVYVVKAQGRSVKVAL